MPLQLTKSKWLQLTWRLSISTTACFPTGVIVKKFEAIKIKSPLPTPTRDLSPLSPVPLTLTPIKGVHHASPYTA